MESLRILTGLSITIYVVPLVIFAKDVEGKFKNDE